MAIYSTTNTFAGSLRAWGGYGAQYGGGGTLLTKTPAGRAKIEVNNGGGAGAARTTLRDDPLLANADIVAGNGGQLVPAGVETYYSLSVVGGGIVTAAIGDTSRLAINVATNCTVDGYSAITVTGHGYAGGVGPGSPGNQAGYCGGAAYGGDGGDGANSPGSRATYGSVAQPTSLGSGGGWSSSASYAGAGGGAVHLVVTGTLHVDGSVSADGSAEASGQYEGSGSGGSLWLEVGTLEGGGLISANGGAAVYPYSSGGGGGGRVAIYSADCFTHFDAGNRVQANGGFGGGPSGTGGKGTILLAYPYLSIGGIEDGFLPPTEPASPSANLVAGLSGFTLVPFDSIPVNGALAHTFAGLPAQTQAAKVVFRARAGTGANVSTDRVSLGYSDGGGFHSVWSRYFGSTNGAGDPGLTGQPWASGRDTSFVFDVASLQPASGPPVDATSLIRSHGHLDLVVMGNTGVDYALLTYGDCVGRATGVDDPHDPLPTVAALRMAPNPFARQTRVTFELPQESYVRLGVFDILGRRVTRLFEGPAVAGVHHLDWIARSSSGGGSRAGVYFVRLETSGRSLVQRVVLVTN